MFKRYADIFRKDLNEFREITTKFYEGEITIPEYKHFSGGFGSYAQRGGKYGMLRLRLCGGRIRKDQLDFVVDSIDKYKIDFIHFTTCQTIQLHDLHADTIMSLIEEAWDVGIITRGGGGDYPRNVMATPLTGVAMDEAFDVTPCVEASADYLLGLIDRVKLPRKLKVAFDSTTENTTHATIRDLGFVAKANGKFDVYSAGGMGRASLMGLLVGEDVEPSQILYYIKAMVDTFITYGNYEQRAKARSRFMQEKLGEEGYVKAFQEKLQDALNEGGLDITVTPTPITKKGCGPISISDNRIIEQKQEGLYAISYHPQGGRPTSKKLHELRDAIKDMDDVELRLSPDQGMFIINLNAKEAEKIHDITNDGVQTIFDTSVACIGATICQVGLQDSQRMLDSIFEAVKKENFKDGVLPKIYISGCPSTCSGHLIGAIGFRGGIKRTDDGPQPAYAMFENGCDTLGHERFATEVGVMTVTDIPKFLVQLGQTISKADTTYAKWIESNHDEFLSIANQYI